MNREERYLERCRYQLRSQVFLPWWERHRERHFGIVLWLPGDSSVVYQYHYHVLSKYLAKQPQVKSAFFQSSENPEIPTGFLSNDASDQGTQPSPDYRPSSFIQALLRCYGVNHYGWQHCHSTYNQNPQAMQEKGSCCVTSHISPSCFGAKSRL